MALVFIQHDYDDIKNWYRQKASENPKIMTYIPSIGKTHEGRDMPAVLITASKDPNRKKVYMQCQIHARELPSSHVLDTKCQFPHSPR